MTSQNNASSQDPQQSTNGFTPLIAWPIALVAVTIGMLLLANTVSAWGSRESDRVEDFKEHAEFFVGRTLRKIDASEEQKTQIIQIVYGTIDELAALHGDRAGMREEIASMMTAPTVDREALETMRSAHLARADQMSRIVSASLADVMDILTVEQRLELKERLEKHGRRHGRGWH